MSVLCHSAVYSSAWLLALKLECCLVNVSLSESSNLESATAVTARYVQSTLALRSVAKKIVVVVVVVVVVCVCVCASACVYAYVYLGRHVCVRVQHAKAAIH